MSFCEFGQNFFNLSEICPKNSFFGSLIGSMIYVLILTFRDTGMAVKTKSLTDAQVAKLGPAKEPHWVATNLYLKVTNKKKEWMVNKTIGGRRKKVLLGTFDEYPSVKKAMTAGFAMEEEIAKPESEKPHTHIPTMSMGTTVAEAWAAHLKNIGPSFAPNRNGRKPKSIEVWEGSLRNHFGSIANLPIMDLTVADVTAALKPIWHTKVETAQRARGRLEAVINSAQAQTGVFGINPAEARHIKATLGKNQRPEVQHIPAPTVDELKKFLADIKDNDAPSAQALRWMAATASRSIEASRLKLKQIDVANLTWTVQIKSPGGHKHWTFPIPKRMKSFIEEAFDQISDTEYVFSTTGKNQLSDTAMSKFVKENSDGKWTAHGIRACFRTWAGKKKFDRVVSELCLSHEVRSKVERSYDRDNRLEERRLVMEEWSRVIDL